MRIIDIHNHISFNGPSDLHDLLKFKEVLSKHNVSKAGIMLNTFSSRGMKEEVLNQISLGYVEDPYLKYNVYLMQSLRESGLESILFPFLYLPVDAKAAQKSSTFYESEYKNTSFGYKVHSQEFRLDISILNGFKSSRPMIVHSSIDDCAHPRKIIAFANSYEGNVIIAHFGKFHISSLKEVSRTPNLFIDGSVSAVMYSALVSNSDRVYHPAQLKYCKSPAELYVMCSKICGADKIVFGSDYPYTEISGKGYSSEISTLLSIPQPLRDKIAYKNAEVFLSRSSQK